MSLTKKILFSLTKRYEFPKIKLFADEFVVVGRALLLKNKREVVIEAQGETIQVDRFVQSLSQIGTIERCVDELGTERFEYFFEISNFAYYCATFTLPDSDRPLVLADGEHEVQSKLAFKTNLCKICKEIGIAAEIQKIEPTKVKLMCCTTQARFYSLLLQVRDEFPG